MAGRGRSRDRAGGARKVPDAPLRSGAMKHARTAGPDLAYRLGSRVVAAVADDMSTTQRVVAGVVAALVAVTPFGAWGEVEAQADPLTPGTAVEVGPFEVTVVRAVTADELSYLTPAPGNHLLALVVDVTNTGDVAEYTSTFGRAVPAPRNVGIIPQEPPAGAEAADQPDEPRLPSPSVLNVEDATSLTFLNPGVSYQLALIWEQSDRWSGTAVPVEMLELEWVEDDPQGLDDGHWFPNQVAFRGRVPVKQPEAGER